MPGATLCVQITPSFLFQAFLHLHEQLRTRADLTTGMTRKQMDKLGDGSNPPYYTITTSEEVRTYAAARPWKTPSHVRSPRPPPFFFSRALSRFPLLFPLHAHVALSQRRVLPGTESDHPTVPGWQPRAPPIVASWVGLGWCRRTDISIDRSSQPAGRQADRSS